MIESYPTAFGKLSANKFQHMKLHHCSYVTCNRFLDVTILSLKHTETVNFRLKMTISLVISYSCICRTHTTPYTVVLQGPVMNNAGIMLGVWYHTWGLMRKPRRKCCKAGYYLAIIFPMPDRKELLSYQMIIKNICAVGRPFIQVFTLPYLGKHMGCGFT